MKISVILVSMELSDNQYAILSPLLPVQRGNVKIHNRQLLNALLYIAENSCKWRRLSKEYGNWHTIYTRLRRWTDNGVLARIFTALLEQRLIATPVECIGLDSTSIKVHPDSCGGLKEMGHKPSENPEADGTPKFIWPSADDRTALKICLSPGQAADGVFGRVLWENWNDKPKGLPDKVATPAQRIKAIKPQNLWLWRDLSPLYRRKLTARSPGSTTAKLTKNAIKLSACSAISRVSATLGSRNSMSCLWPFCSSHAFGLLFSVNRPSIISQVRARRGMRSSISIVRMAAGANILWSKWGRILMRC